VADGETIEIKLAKRAISLAVPHNISFYDSLRNKLMWGVDNR
jgi:NAD+ kinase